jgi:hypothetical protein
VVFSGTKSKDFSTLLRSKHFLLELMAHSNPRFSAEAVVLDEGSTLFGKQNIKIEGITVADTLKAVTADP